MTTTVEPRIAVPAPATPAAAPTPSTPQPAPSTTPKQRRTAEQRLRFWLAAVGIPGALLIGGIGFGLSFHNLTGAGTKWGFGDNASWFAIGMDASIVTFLVIDLLLTLIGVRFGLLRLLAHLMTLATIVFNAAAFGSPLAHPVRSAAHGLMPVLFIVGVEAGRRVLLKHAALQKGTAYEPIGLTRWLLAPIDTWLIWRGMKIHAVPSYTTMLAVEQDRAVYRAWLDHRQEIEAGHKKGNVSALDRLPITMRKFGLTVDEALALPDKMRRDELRRTQEAERRALALTLEQEKATAQAEKQRLRTQADIAAVRAEVEAETTVAQARAESAGATARLEAATVLSAAERAAEESKRRAATAAEAEETAATAEAKRRAAEDEAAAVEARRAALEGARELADEERRIAVHRDKTAAVNLRALEGERAAEAAALETERLVAERLEVAARAKAAELRALEADEAAGLKPTERAARRVARLALTQYGGDTEAMGNGPVMELLSASLATASARRSEAADLIKGGYRPRD
ncbi:DUF2637 domain-containing protein [Streptomyces sp. NPDC056132]|uniref:DUF2637 domain-containing protein n=1 Tax=Streptomyces sp. NPDC056132 TaxID=3345722 RepID=UPI0035D5F9EF